MTVPNFLSKAFFYQDLCRGEGGGKGAGAHYVLPLPRGVIRQKYSEADKVKTVLKTLELQKLSNKLNLKVPGAS